MKLALLALMLLVSCSAEVDARAEDICEVCANMPLCDGGQCIQDGGSLICPCCSPHGDFEIVVGPDTFCLPQSR